MSYAAILSSRQARRPCGTDTWVQQTVRAVNTLAETGATIVSSVGMQTWELVTAMAALREVPLYLIVPSESIEEFEREKEWIEHEFGMSHDRVIFESTYDLSNFDDTDPQISRDLAVIQRADRLLPISIRPEGNMAQTLKVAEQTGRQVIRDFQIDYQARENPVAYSVSPDRIRPELDSLGGEYLIHWTRASNGPWPGERRVEYYRDVASSSRYPRTAFDSLTQILRTGRIMGSPRHMPANTPTVSMTGLSPTACIPLMRWRARYGEMSFEPYGIGISRKLAEQIDIKPVEYYDDPANPPPGVDLWRTQFKGTKTDWRQENEYRFRGDFDFSSISRDAVVAFCLNHDEARQIETQFGVRAISFY